MGRRLVLFCLFRPKWNPMIRDISYANHTWPTHSCQRMARPFQRRSLAQAIDHTKRRLMKEDGSPIHAADLPSSWRHLFVHRLVLFLSRIYDQGGITVLSVLIHDMHPLASPGRAQADPLVEPFVRDRSGLDVSIPVHEDITRCARFGCVRQPIGCTRRFVAKPAS